MSPHDILRAHGGQILHVMKNFPHAPQPYIDLSTGISPFPYPYKQPPRKILEGLPQQEDTDHLQRAAADLWGLPETQDVVLVPGTQSFIAMLPYCFAPHHVFTLCPTYGGYKESFQKTAIPFTSCQQSSDLIQAARHTKSLIILCNPNNPDGRICPQQHISTIAQNCKASDSLFILDEAYHAFAHKLSPAPAHPNIVRLRSFGKTYGLGGLRLGFVIADKPRAHTIRSFMGAWAISTLALNIGRQALEDRTWLEKTRKKVESTHQHLTHLLEDVHLTPQGHATLFVLIQLPQAHALWKHLCRCGIVTRIFPQLPHHIRIGLPKSTKAFKRLKDALTDWKSR